MGVSLSDFQYLPSLRLQAIDAIHMFPLLSMRAACMLHRAGWYGVLHVRGVLHGYCVLHEVRCMGVVCCTVRSVLYWHVIAASATDPVSGEANANPSQHEGYLSFDDLGSAMIVLFQTLTLDDWSSILYPLPHARARACTHMHMRTHACMHKHTRRLAHRYNMEDGNNSYHDYYYDNCYYIALAHRYNVEDGNNSYFARIYFIVFIFIGAMYFMNITLAIVPRPTP